MREMGFRGPRAAPVFLKATDHTRLKWPQVRRRGPVTHQTVGGSGFRQRAGLWSLAARRLS